jgi:hypothetical protein
MAALEDIAELENETATDTNRAAGSTHPPTTAQTGEPAIVPSVSNDNAADTEDTTSKGREDSSADTGGNDNSDVRGPDYGSDYDGDFENESDIEGSAFGNDDPEPAVSLVNKIEFQMDLTHLLNMHNANSLPLATSGENNTGVDTGVDTDVDDDTGNDTDEGVDDSEDNDNDNDNIGHDPNWRSIRNGTYIPTEEGGILGDAAPSYQSAVDPDQPLYLQPQQLPPNTFDARVVRGRANNPVYNPPPYTSPPYPYQTTEDTVDVPSGPEDADEDDADGDVQMKNTGNAAGASNDGPVQPRANSRRVGSQGGVTDSGDLLGSRLPASRRRIASSTIPSLRSTDTRVLPQNDTGDDESDRAEDS